MEFSEKLQQLRKENGLTQEQLADKIFVSRTAISKWESGRGYPSLDYLKSVSKLFSTSIDDLLSGEELVKIAETDSLEKTESLRSLVFGILDCMPALLFFLPFFGQKEQNSVRTVSLLSLGGVNVYVRSAFIIFTGFIVIFGIASLALQNLQHRLWLKTKLAISIFLGISGVMLFIVSPHPYAAVFMLCLLVFKGVFLLRKQ
jgi:transcriptional regulator with XRE-family HTH domain